MTHLRAFLGADDAALTHHLTHDGPLEPVLGAIGRELTGPARAALAAELATAAGGLLEEDLGAMLLGGLMSYRGLLDAGQETTAEPDLTRLVLLDDHLVRVVHEPHLDVIADRRQVYELRLTLTVEFTVEGLAATVRGGHLVHVRAARCAADAELAWAGHPLLHHSGLVDAPLVMRLGAGIPLPAPAAVPALARGTARVRPR
ncbi:hypothetical protein GCM10020358_32710 [Amorphoplanes nipponensis]|uniref:Uncharacterized protein n=1 Tax=Actinoplanes nipponensis TaxID=135950 RepID=A0A919JHV7_9ACTN|nr:hypothetical protein [Actinoplanes nipponensis]GIE51314.1 hypothetical protein Ani05nite_48480 [Actinoplanes nipponensis]